MRLKSHYLWNAVVYNRNDATINLRVKREDKFLNDTWNERKTNLEKQCQPTPGHARQHYGYTYYYCIAMVTKFDTPLLPIRLHDKHSRRHTHCTFLTAPLRPRENKGRFHKWPVSPPSLPRLSPVSAWHAIVCNNKSKTFKAGQVKRRIIGRNDGMAKGEWGEEASWFIFKDTPYCIFNNFPRCAGTTRQFTSTTLEFTPYWGKSPTRLTLGFLLQASSPS